MLTPVINPNLRIINRDRLLIDETRIRPPVLNLRWPAARVKILIVCDGNDYSTSPFGFGLGLMLQDAFNPAHMEYPDYARFEFTKAHRTNATGVDAGYSNFTFTPGSLDDFDELWLFGFSGGTPYIQGSELNVVEAFMDAGGGVLAMGDHEDLGLGLCGGIKRVRSMRKWWFNSPAPPANHVKAPDSHDLTRNDTVQPASPGGVPDGGDQSDGVPQPIYPNYRYRWQNAFLRPYHWIKYPHPVLCGPRGTMKVMPDHAHEGDCIVPHSAFAGEYPGSVPVEIVARGRNVVGRHKPTFSGQNEITEAREFGLIGAWDGHHTAANKGRVLVDSTWHHWFNVNLTGLRPSSGLESDFSVPYKDILAYFRNCATWLAPKTKQTQMRRAGTLIALMTADLVEDIVGLQKLRPELFHRFGTLARDALGKTAPQCQSAAWIFELVRPHLSQSFISRMEEIEKKGPDALDPLERDMEAMMIDSIGTTILGGAVQQIATKIDPRMFHDIADMAPDIDNLAAKGAKQGAELAEKKLKKMSDSFAKLLR